MNKTVKPKTLDLRDDDLLFWEHDGKEYCLHVRQEDQIDDPRREEDHITTMACFHRRHTLGDDTGFKDPGAFMRSLAERLGDKAVLAKKIRKLGVPKRTLDAVLDSVDPSGKTRKRTASGTPLPENITDEDLFQAFLDALEDDPGMSGLAIDVIREKAAVLPIWLYDHSGLTISCDANPGYPYNDRWDACQVGWIVAEKDKIMDAMMCQEHEWREKAVDVMKADISTYDMYLSGEVYWFQLRSRPAGTEPSDQSSADEWDEMDSCGGFYGADAIASGMLEAADNGCLEAVEAERYSTGKAKAIERVEYVLERD